MELAPRADARRETSADRPDPGAPASPPTGSVAPDDGIIVRQADLADAVQAAAVVEILDSHARSVTSRGAALDGELTRRLVRDLRAHEDVIVLLAQRNTVSLGVAVCLRGGSTFAPDVLRVHDLAVTTAYAGDRFEAAMTLMRAAERLAHTLPPSPGLSARPAPDLYPPVGSDVLQGWDMFVGGRIDAETYLAALRHGVFLLGGAKDRRWCGPARRGLFPLDRVGWPSSVRRAIRRPRFRITIDEAFVDVVRACADRPGGKTWLADDVLALEVSLHERGLAHSVEVWNADTNTLVGGIFGVSMGGVFAGESMFHREKDASKVAFAALVDRLRSARYQLFDVQLLTPHLASLGCVEVPREHYRRELAAAIDVPRTFYPG